MSATSEPARIRRATADDSEAVAAVLVETGWFAHLAGAGADAIVRGHLGAALANDDHLVLVAEARDAVVGYAAVHWLPYLMLPAAEGYVSEVFVLEAHRGHGIGRTLLGKIRVEAERRGVWKLNLLNVRARPSYERRFFAKCGWIERPEAANFILPVWMPRPEG